MKRSEISSNTGLLFTSLLLIVASTQVVLAASSIQTDDGMVPYTEYTPSAYTLEPSEVAEIRARVLRKCAIRSTGRDEQLPWYFNYEFGQELVAAGDTQRGLDALILAANQRQTSQRNSRMYGMWYTNYLPYYRIAQAHSQLGNWACAMDAIRLSNQNTEFTRSDRGYEAYSDLQKMIQLNAQPDT